MSKADNKELEEAIKEMKYKLCIQDNQRFLFNKFKYTKDNFTRIVTKR